MNGWCQGVACSSEGIPAIVRGKYLTLESSIDDVAALGCILADEFEEADFDGSVIDRSTMIANTAKPGKGHSELTDLHVHIYGEAAYVRGIGVNSQNGRPTGKTRFTDIFVYRGGRWQCVAGHGSRFPNRQ